MKMLIDILCVRIFLIILKYCYYMRQLIIISDIRQIFQLILYLLNVKNKSLNLEFHDIV